MPRRPKICSETNKKKVVKNMPEKSPVILALALTTPATITRKRESQEDGEEEKKEEEDEGGVERGR